VTLAIGNRGASRAMSASRLKRSSFRISTLVAALGYVFLLAPLLIVVPLSVGNPQQMVFPPTEFSATLYYQYLSSAPWQSATLQSLYVACGATVIAVLVSVPAAYALVRFDLAAKPVISLLLLSPMLTPGVVMGLGLSLYFGTIGLLGSTVGLILAHATLVTPFVLIAAIGGFRHVDPNLEVAARIMGANTLTLFLKVLLPQIKTAVIGGALLAFALSFDEVVIAYFLSGSTNPTLPVQMYSTIRWEVSPIIAAVSTLLTALSLIIALAMMRLQAAER